MIYNELARAMSWPNERNVMRAVTGGMSEVIRTPLGNGRGLRSEFPWVYFIAAGARSFAYCERCGEAPQPPEPPGSAPPGAPRTTLLEPGTHGHALFLLTWLNEFSRKHSECQEKV